MHTPLVSRVLAPVAALLLAVTPALADEFPRPTTPYSADYVMHVVSGGQTADLDGRIEVDGLKERHENNMRGTRSTLIMRLDKQVTWVLLPEQDVLGELDGIADRIGGTAGRLDRAAPGRRTPEGRFRNRQQLRNDEVRNDRDRQ